MATVKNYQDTLEKEQQAYQYFTSRGYSPQATVGILGNLMHESGLKTTVEGDKGYKGGSSFGAAQWRGERLGRLKKMYGKDWNNFNNQLEFVDWELNNTHKKAGERLRTATTSHEAGQAFSDLYEIPAKKYYQDSNRQNAVKMVEKRFLGTSSTPIYDTQVQPFITNDLSNLPIQNESRIFANELNYIGEAQGQGMVAEKEEEKPSKEKEELSQEVNEYKLKQELFDRMYAKPESITPELEEESIQQTPTKSVEQIYNEAASIVGMQQGGKIPISSNGVWDSNHKPVIVPSPNITMVNVPYEIIGISKETGEQKLMKPEQNYFFENTQNVIEIPQLNKYLNG